MKLTRLAMNQPSKDPRIPHACRGDRWAGQLPTRRAGATNPPRLSWGSLGFRASSHSAAHGSLIIPTTSVGDCRSHAGPAVARKFHKQRHGALRSADFQSAVSQVSNLLSVGCEKTVCRLEVRDTADWKSALPSRQSTRAEFPRLLPDQVCEISGLAKEPNPHGKRGGFEVPWTAGSWRGE